MCLGDCGDQYESIDHFQISTDPDGANSRSVMEAVKTLFNRVIESSRYASSIARYCSYVIEVYNKWVNCVKIFNETL